MKAFTGQSDGSFFMNIHEISLAALQKGYLHPAESQIILEGEELLH